MAGVGSFVVLNRIRRDVPAVRTAEGRMARVLALLPVAIIAVRCGYLYAASAVSIGSLALLAYATLRQLTANAPRQLGLRRTLEAFSVVPALVTALAAAELTDSVAGYAIDNELAIAAFALILVLALVDLARRSMADGAVYARGAALVALLAGISELVFEPAMATALVCALTSACVAVYTRTAGFEALYRMSLVALLGAMGYHVYIALGAFDLGGWLGLATLGVVAIVAAAAVERHGERIKALMVSAWGTRTAA